MLLVQDILMFISDVAAIYLFIIFSEKSVVLFPETRSHDECVHVEIHKALTPPIGVMILMSKTLCSAAAAAASNYFILIFYFLFVFFCSVTHTGAAVNIETC